MFDPTWPRENPGPGQVNPHPHLGPESPWGSWCTPRYKIDPGGPKPRGALCPTVTLRVRVTPRIRPPVPCDHPESPDRP